MGQRFILASASPRRIQLLRQIQIEAEVIPSHIEESVHGLGPKETVMTLSRQKAADVAARQGEGAVVIGADTVVAIEDKILGKPSDKKEAAAMLALLAGETHQVYTGVTVLPPHGESSLTFCERTDVTVYPMTEDEIVAYVDSGEPMDKAGAYGIQGRFAAHIQKIQGDYNNVVGLPLSRLYRELLEMGTDLLEEWRNP